MYIRDEMSCNSEACDMCVSEGEGKIMLSAKPYNHQYLIMDAEVLVNQSDLLQQEIPPLCDVIILQSVLLEVAQAQPVCFQPNRQPAPQFFKALCPFRQPKLRAHLRCVVLSLNHA